MVTLDIVLILQLKLVLVGGLRTASDLVLGCRCPCHSVCRTVHLQVVCILQYLPLVAQLVTLLVLIVADHDHSLIACVGMVSLNVRLSSAVLWTSLFVYHLALVLVLVIRVLRFRRHCNIGRHWSLILLNSSLVWNDDQIALIVAILRTGRLEDYLTVVVRVAELADNLAILAVALGSALSLATLADRMLVGILVHEARILTIGVLLNQGRVRLVSIVSTRNVIEYLWGAILVLHAASADVCSVCERVLGLQVEVVVLHHAVVVTCLAVSGRVRHCRGCGAETCRPGLENVADSLAASLVLGVASLRG